MEETMKAECASRAGEAAQEGAECGAGVAARTAMGEAAVVERSYLPATQDPAAMLGDAPAAQGASAQERTEALYERLRSSRRFLDAILEFCREERGEDEVAGEVARIKEREFSIYGADVLCAHLVQAGALERIEPAVQDVRVVEVDGVQYLEPAGQGDPADGGEHEMSAAPAQVRLRTTPAGLAALDCEQDMGRFQEILDEDAGYANIYRMLLYCCANEGGATAEQLGDAVNGQPELQEPRLYASYFFEKLAACDLIEWTGASWGITGFGRRAVRYLDERA